MATFPRCSDSEAFLNLDGEEPEKLEVNQDGQLFVEGKIDASRGYNFSLVEKEHGFAFLSLYIFCKLLRSATELN